MKSSDESPVSFVANVARLPQKGMPVVIEADANQRAQAGGGARTSLRRAAIAPTCWLRRGSATASR